MHSVVFTSRGERSFYDACRCFMPTGESFFMMHSVVFLHLELLGCQPRAFSHARGVCHLDSGFLSLTPSHHYVPVVTDELLRYQNTCLTQATNIIMVPTRITFLITPLLSTWLCGPKIGFGSRGLGGGGGGD